MQELLAVIAKGLVDDPDAVNVEADAPAEDGTIVYHIHVAENDMGRIIGKQGRIARLSAQLPAAQLSAAKKR